MVFKETEFQLKDGRTALLRSPREDDAAEMLQFIRTASGETDFLLRYPEEWADTTLEQEKAFINADYCNPNGMMIACVVDGKIAGSCQISFRTGLKDRHRASVAIAILQEYWNLGIGTKMFEEMLRIASERGVRQIELGFIEGNSRARASMRRWAFASRASSRTQSNGKTALLRMNT